MAMTYRHHGCSQAGAAPDSHSVAWTPYSRPRAVPVRAARPRPCRLRS